MKKVFFLLAGIICSFLLRSQELPVYEQYLLNRYLINPAYTGYEKCPSIRITDRHQWIGIKEAPNTQTITFDTRFWGNNGLGVHFMHDANGPNSALSLQLTYAYHMLWYKHSNSNDRTFLSFGASLSGSRFSLDESNLKAVNPDPTLTGETANVFSPNARVGVYLYSNKMYAGLTLAELIDAPISPLSQVEKEPSHPKYLFFITGYYFSMGEKWDFEPSVAFKVNTETYKQADLNVKLHYKRMHWLGFSFRKGLDMETTDIQALCRFSLPSGLFLGYCFDLNISPLWQNHFGSHEFMIGFNICPSRDKYSCPAY